MYSYASFEISEGIFIHCKNLWESRQQIKVSIMVKAKLNRVETAMLFLMPFSSLAPQR